LTPVFSPAKNVFFKSNAYTELCKSAAEICQIGRPPRAMHGLARARMTEMFRKINKNEILAGMH
jgi:predicted transglutaminase-like cysteine proteinase